MITTAMVKSLFHELEIVVARVKPDHRHLVDPVHDEVSLGCGDALWVWREVPLFHIRYNCRMATFEGLVEEMDQLSRIF